MTHVFDFAVQFGIDDWLVKNRPELPHATTLDDLVATVLDLHQHGYQYHGAAIFPFPSAPERDFRAGNAAVQAAAAETLAGEPLRLIPIHAVIPKDERSVGCLEEVLASGAPCLGIKLWPYMSHIPLTALLEDQCLIDLLIKHRLLVLMHVGTGRESQTRPAFPNVKADPQTAVDVARALPEVDFVLGHMLRLSRSALQSIAGRPNVYLDTSGITSMGRWLEGGKNALPADDALGLDVGAPGEILARIIREFDLVTQLLFGTAWPYCCWWGSSPRDEVEVVLRAPLEQAAQNAVLFGNAASLLEKHGLRVDAPGTR